MKIALIQTDIFWEDKLKNLDKIEQLISRCPPDTDIAILPEMFNTGFSINPFYLAEPPGSVTFEWMKSIALRYSFGICGSYIVSEDMNYYNRWIFVSPGDAVPQYDKRHLFSIGGEDKLFSKGIERVVFSFRGVRILPNVCYDLRFPVWSRVKNDYDILINSANWPESRRDVWITLLKARAIENQCYVAGVNRVGIDGTGVKYCGDSLVVNPRGEVIASAVKDKECVISSEISVTELSDFRKKFPVLNDADNFTIVI